MEHHDSLLTGELDAMAVIGRVLENLPDDTARQRVLHWARERFGAQAFAAVASAHAVPGAEAIAPADDPALQLDSLDDMFEMAAPDKDDLTIGEPIPQPSDTSKQPVESVLRSFVADFQRFAEEWNGATA